MKKSLLKNYAKLIAKVGVNVQKGQDVYVVCDLEQPNFVYMVVEELYKLGANRVIVDFSSQTLEKLAVKYQKLKTLSTFDRVGLEKLKWRAESLPAHLYLISDDPDGLKGIDIEKYTKARIEKLKVSKPLRDSMDGKYQWCIAGVPGEKWAKKVFPNLSKNKAIDKLWEGILTSSRAIGDGILNWQEHNKNIKEKCKILNSLNLRKLHYTNSLGTDLTVWLNPLGEFHGGYDTTLNGINFNPNIPSEEIFTSPLKGNVEGIVYATKPLSYQGQLIEGFYIKFENGRVKETYAKCGDELLKKMVNMDEGASMLGEVALVPFNSPINNSGILFYETLYDENASCHLALGEGFFECIKGYENMTRQETLDKGVNDSSIHVDFMVGSKDLKIDGYDNKGNLIHIFVDGDWAI